MLEPVIQTCPDFQPPRRLLAFSQLIIVYYKPHSEYNILYKFICMMVSIFINVKNLNHVNGVREVKVLGQKTLSKDTYKQSSMHNGVKMDHSHALGAVSIKLGTDNPHPSCLIRSVMNRYKPVYKCTRVMDILKNKGKKQVHPTNDHALHTW